MPCRVEEFEGEHERSVVQDICENGPTLVRWIIALGAAMKEPTAIDGKGEVLISTFALNSYRLMPTYPKHGKVVDIRQSNEGKQRANLLYDSHTTLYNTLTVEMCRLCKLSEKKPGKFLTSAMHQWWKKHKTSAGHQK